MLNAIVFTCGAALMGMEMAAARVLAPVLGNSIYVWGSVISVVMVALSIGYWLGGQIADRFGAARILPVMVAGAALATVAVPFIASVALHPAASLGPRLGALAASLSIFFVPSVLLATVSPLGVRLVAERGMHRIGRSAGGLYAVSTAGSIVGTIATSFWLIPLLELEPLIVWTGILLGVTALVSLWLRDAEKPVGSLPGQAELPTDSPEYRYRLTRVLTRLVVAATVALASWTLADVTVPPTANEFGERIIFRADSQYHRITVTEDDEVRHLRFDRSHQSAVSLSDEFESTIKYPNYLHLAYALQPEARNVLVLGLGGGSVSKRYWRDYPEVHVDSIEVDPVVVDVAREYFGLPEDPRLEVFAEDGRRYVQATERMYDIVIIDAYNADSMPYHLTTEEFFGEIDAVLNPGGVVAYNIISSVEGTRSKLFRSLYKTAGSVWSERWVVPIGLGNDGSTTTNRNIILLATDSVVPSEEFEARVAGRVGGRVTIDGFPSFLDDLYMGVIDVNDVPLLTDTYAPVDSLIEVN
ncbi:MAG: fused MFS/spermidine synthase [Coriobacteriia bacterium]|nr:fused MFS/spermidine synthase [Coriobacteriia bacterium]